MSGPSSTNPGAVLTAVNTACRGGLRPVLTAAPPGALPKLGRDGETASSHRETAQPVRSASPRAEPGIEVLSARKGEKGVMLKARPGRQNPQPSSDEMSAGMIGSRPADRIKAAVMRTANAVHMTAPVMMHHAKKLLQQGSDPVARPAKPF